MSQLGPRLIITAWDTDVIEVPVSPASALAGSHVEAKLWFGPIKEPTWSFTWDTTDPNGIEVDVEAGLVRLATGVAPWTLAAVDRSLEMKLVVRVSRGGTSDTVFRGTVTVQPQPIEFAAEPDPGDVPEDGSLTEVWVDGDAGSDLAAGTEDDPVRTLARGLELLAESDASVVYVRQATEPYDGSVFARSLNRTGNTSFVAVGDWVEEVALFAVGLSAGVELVATTDPGWSENAFPLAGQFLEVVSSSDPDLVGQRRSITRNTSDHVWVAASLSKEVPAGTTVRVVSPPVRMRLSGTFVGGTSRNALLRFDGFDFVVDAPWAATGNTADSVATQGALSFFGARISGALGYLYLRADGDLLWAGTFDVLPQAGLGLSVQGYMSCLSGNVSGVFVCQTIQLLGGVLVELAGFSALGGFKGLVVNPGGGGYATLGSVAPFAGRPKAPIFISGTSLWLDINGNGIVRIRTRVEQIVTSTEARIGERSHLNTQNPDLLVTPGAIRVQENGSYRIDGTPARNSPPGGGFIVGESSFQFTAPDLDDDSLDPKGRLVSPIDGSRIYWATPEPT